MTMPESGDAEVPVAQNLIRLLHREATPENGRLVIQVSERVFEALRVRLSQVLGAGGYATLLARSFALTRTVYPWMIGVNADKDGSLAGRFEKFATIQDTLEMVHGFAALITRFVTLLTTFIGEENHL